jgi:polyisoprenoid-binding protein YceI
MKLVAIAMTAFSILLAACEDPAANKVRATVNEPSADRPAYLVGPPAARAPKGEALAISSETSKIEFTGSKVTGKHDGGFGTFTGTIDLVNGDPANSSVSTEIDADSVFSDDEKLTSHLKSKDFFDVAKFPKASFASAKIERDAGAGPDAYLITGDFTLHGVTKSISFPATISVSDTNVVVNSEFTLNRKDFAIVYEGKADDLIRDGVVIRLNFRTPRKK